MVFLLPPSTPSWAKTTLSGHWLVTDWPTQSMEGRLFFSLYGGAASLSQSRKNRQAKSDSGSTWAVVTVPGPPCLAVTQFCCDVLQVPWILMRRCSRWPEEAVEANSRS